MTGVLIRRGDTQRRGHVRTEVEAEGVSTNQGLRSTRSWKRQEGVFPRNVRGSVALLTPGFQTSSIKSVIKDMPALC